MKRLLPLLLLPALFGSSNVHLGVESSWPAKGDTIGVPFDSVRVTFTQPVQLQFTHLTLVGVQGDTFPGTQQMIGDRSVRLTLGRKWPSAGGAYAIRWRTAGADGHVVSGEIPFTVIGVPDPPPPPDSAPSVVDRMAEMMPREAEPNRGVYAVALRWLNFTSILLIIGSVIFTLLLAAQSGALASAFVDAAGASARRIALTAGIAALLLAVPRLLMQAAQMHGAVTWEMAALTPILSDTNWGRGWVLQSLGSMGFVMSAFAADDARSGAWKLALASVVVLAFGPAFSGHAAAIENSQFISITADAVHVLAASAWLGTLALILLAALPTGEHGSIAQTIRSFSPLALIAAATAAFTGSVSAFAHLGSVSQMWTTSYGRMLGFKLIAVALTALIGFYNWRRVKPVLGSAEGTRRLRPSATLETLTAVAVLLLTAILVALPTP